MNNTNNQSPSPKKSRRNYWNPLQESEKNKFSVQQVPSLSLRQFIREKTVIIERGKEWRPSGVYHPPINIDDEKTESKKSKQSPDTPKESKQSTNTPKKAFIKLEPIWRPAGIAPFKPSKTLEDEKEKEKQKSKSNTNDSGKNKNQKMPPVVFRKIGPPWRPSTTSAYHPTPYFDYPSLRWSSKDIIKSMPELERAIEEASKRS